jgi:hypothetical protein
MAEQFCLKRMRGTERGFAEEANTVFIERVI